MNQRFENRLAGESSPYLRQHAHNPVAWYPWGEEALQRAREEKKPLLISIGYAACHWCHVMERESFENEEVAAFMNEHFVNIKVDREERPDLDHIYMDAVQAISGSGGWPLNVFCTSDAKPFFGGTYFPPRRAFNRMSWLEVLQRIHHVWTEQRDTFDDQANRLLTHISSRAVRCAETDDPFTPDQCRQMAATMMQAADREKGGFGSAPKFPHTVSLRFLLEYAHLFKDGNAGDWALFSIRKLIRGGIYDHLGGGMARYSTDDDWLAPHFEKMLYDNALLIRLLSDAYQSSRDEEFRHALYKTAGFLQREMKHPDGGYFAALDADSEGEEGRYYVWDKTEIKDLLGPDADLFCSWFGVTEEGNWERQNILHVSREREAFCKEHGLDVASFAAMISSASEKLMRQREQRIRPGTDDKILLGWNALWLTGFCRAFAATGDDHFKDQAISLHDFIKRHFFQGDDGVFHTYKEGKARISAFADDLAYWIEACIHLQEITGDQAYLQEAERVTRMMDIRYLLPSGYYSYTKLSQEDVLYPRPEIYDGAVPSANAVMAHNLHYLSLVFDNPDWESRSSAMVHGLLDGVLKHPVSFSSWSLLLMYKSLFTNEIICTGIEMEAALSQILSQFIPNRILQSTKNPSNLPLFRGKKVEKHTLIYLCKNKYCMAPIDDPGCVSEKLAGM